MMAWCRFCGMDLYRAHWVLRDARQCGGKLCAEASAAELAWMRSRGPDGERTKEAADLMYAAVEGARGDKGADAVWNNETTEDEEETEQWD